MIEQPPLNVVLEFVLDLFIEFGSVEGLKLILAFRIVPFRGDFIFTLSILFMDFSKTPKTACVVKRLLLVIDEPVCTAFNESLL